MDWFGILEVARSLSPNKSSTFTCLDLNKKVRFSKTATRTSDQISSAWVCKLVKWGYAERVGSHPNPGHKPIAVYAVTPKGHEARNTSSTAGDAEELDDLDKLRDAVRIYEGARNARTASMGKKGEPKAAQEEQKAFLELLALCDELDRKEFGVD